MCRLCSLAVLLLTAGCVDAPSNGMFPRNLRGTWAETPAACAAPQVRVTATTLSAHRSLCRAESAAPAAGGGLLVRLRCTRPDGAATEELSRLSRQGDRLQLQVGDARLAWTRCG